MQIVAFFARALVSVAVYELAGFIVGRMMANPAAAILEALGVDFMGEADLRSSQFSEDVFMG
jgi:hypothetical protein